MKTQVSSSTSFFNQNDFDFNCHRMNVRIKQISRKVQSVVDNKFKHFEERRHLFYCETIPKLPVIRYLVISMNQIKINIQ